MKAISCRMPVKIAAFFLLSVSLAFCVLGGLGISLLAEAGYYDADPPSFYDSTFCETVTEEYANEVFNTYMAFSQTDTDASSQFQMEQLKKKFSSENTNFFFILQNGSGNILFSNYDDRLEYGSNISYHMDYDSVSYSNHSNNLLLSSAVIHCFVRDPISANDDYAEALHLFNLLFSVRYTLIVLTVLQLPLILFGLTLLLCGAGYPPIRTPLSYRAFTAFRLICTFFCLRFRSCSALGCFSRSMTAFSATESVTRVCPSATSLLSYGSFSDFWSSPCA